MATSRILIVEDQREVSRLLRSALETLEYKLNIIEVPSGEEALLDSTRNKIDLLVADYRLPGISGLELMAKVRNSQPEAKIILITGLTDAKVRKKIAEADAHAYFFKPVPMADFLDSVTWLLGLGKANVLPKPIASNESTKHRNLPDLLAGLRQEVEAKTVILLDAEGHILARAGDLNDRDVESSLLSLLLSIYSAGQNVSKLIGQESASHWHVFDGGEYNLIFAPVDTGYAMLMVGEKLAVEDHLLSNIKIFSDASALIKQIIEEMVVPVKKEQEAESVSLESEKKSAAELEPLFKEAKKKLKTGEVDAFWTKAAEEYKAPAQPETLTYEQAKQIGLTPEEKS